MTDIVATNDKALFTQGLQDAFAEFLRLNVADGDASPKTIASYLTEVRMYSAWCNDNGIRPARATDDQVREYRRHLVDAGYTRGTVATKLTIVRRFYEAAVWRGLRPDNPAAGIKAPSEKTQPEDRVKFLPLPAFKQVLNITDNERDAAILALMGRQGLRVDEVARLQLDDLDLDNDGLIMVTGKGNKRRKVYLVESTVATLRRWLAIRPENDDRTVFISQANNTPPGPMTTRAIRYLVDKYLDQAGLKAEGISCHSLRHSFATYARFGGADLGAIAADLGHASTKTTEVYAKIVDRIKNNPARYLEKVLTSA